MSNCINKLVQYVNTSLNGYCDKTELDVVCASISVMYAIRKLERKDFPEYYYYQPSEEYKRLKNYFEKLISWYDYYIKKLSPHHLAQINYLIDNILIDSDDDVNLVSWIYQQLKTSLAKEALKRIGSEKNKIIGTDILVQTQFFTDNYMVKFLVDKIFEMQKQKLPDVVFVDPACGGGNFLTYIYSKLYEWYSTHTEYDPETINSLILKNNIVGYDLDNTLSQIAGLSLYICSRIHTSVTDIPDIYIYGGESGDLRGFLTQNVSSNIIGDMNMSEKMSIIREKQYPIVYITNPPFMGKRDMDIRLKEYLQTYYPHSKGDLCFSFMEQVMHCMRDQDVFASVTQNGWLTLSTLKNFREKLLEGYYIHTCIDMGTNAFENINGEKTNIVLSIITGKDGYVGQETMFANLRGFNLTEKKKILREESYHVHSVRMDKFKENANYEFCYQLGNDIDRFKTMRQYGYYSKCMQGSSTGDNKTMVKYIWETDDPEWVLASKGGGYSKWEGLNLFKVKWGQNGELLKNNKGSALRNSSEIENASLVYSDTGTLGLSTRLRMDGQVFIASGPGIKVLRGNPLCHLAFLNSKISTYFLKVLNPKFTVSAGYINKIPVVDGILDDTFLSNAAEKCIKLKCEYLSHKLPNLEFVHDNYKEIIDVNDYLENSIRGDILNQYRRHIYEREINNYIVEKYQLSETQKAEYDNMMGNNITYIANIPSIRIIDKMLSSTLNDSCQSVSRKLNGYIVGTENCIDMISYMYSLPPKVIAKLLFSNISSLSYTRKKYKLDLVHKLILKVADVNTLSHITNTLDADEEVIYKKIKENYPVLFRQLNITHAMIRDIVENIHKKCFYNKPLLFL